MKANTWKKTAAFVLALTLVSGAMPSNYGGLFKGGNVIVANAGNPSDGDSGLTIGSGSINPADDIPYMAWESEQGKLVEQTLSRNTERTNVESGTTTWNDGWYVVSGNITISQRITVTNTVNLILSDGAKLTAEKGINVTESNTLNIYAQSEGENCGVLEVTGDRGCAGIGGNTDIPNGGIVTIYGGTVNATSGMSGAGIGGGCNANGGGSGGTVTIYGGTVNAIGNADEYGYGGAGIGGGGTSGNGGSGGIVTIYGGTVNAIGTSQSAGIGGGKNAVGGTVTIYGGTVTATGGSNCVAIGGGSKRVGNNQFEQFDGGQLFIAEGMTVKAGNDADSAAPVTNYSANGSKYVMISKEPHSITISDNAPVTVTQNGEPIDDPANVFGEVTFTSREPFKVTMGGNTYQATEIVDDRFSLPLNITADATVEIINVELELNTAVTEHQPIVNRVTYDGTVPLWLSLGSVNESDNNSESSPYDDHDNGPREREWRKVEDFRARDTGKYRVYYCFYQGDNEYDRPSPDTQGMALPYTITVNGFTPDPVIRNDLTYNGQLQELLIDAAHAAFGTVKYRLGESGDYSEDFRSVTAANAGPYTVYYMVEAKSEENGWAGINGSVEVTINKATMNVDPPTVIQGLKYTGNLQQLIASPPTVYGVDNTRIDDPTIEYAVTPAYIYQEPDEADFRTDLPKETAVNDYKVWYKVIDGGNNYNTYTNYVEVSIAPAEPNITLNSNLTYNGENQQLITSIDYPQGGTNLFLRIQSGNNDSYPYNWIRYEGPETLRRVELMAKNAGNYRVYYYNDRIAPNETESGKLCGNICTIHKANLTAGDFRFVPPNNPIYDGNPKQADVQFNNDNEPLIYTVKYYSDPNREIEVLQPTDAGTYYVGVTWDDSANYNASDQLVFEDSWQFTINQAAPTLEKFYVYVPTDLTYDGSGKAVIVTPNVGGMGNAVAVYSTDNGTTWSITPPKNAGEYRFGIKVEEGQNYTAQNTPLTDETMKFTISKANWENITAPQAVNELVYNGSERVLFTESNLPQGADIQYKRIEDNQGISDVIAALNSDEGWNTEIPKQIDAKPYFFYIYRVAGDENHNVYPNFVNDINDFIIKAQIDKADVSVDEAPTAINNLYFNGQPMALINAGRATGGTFEYSVQGNSTEIQWSSEIPERTEAGTYNVYWRVVGDSNHNNFEPLVPIAVTINEDAEVTAVIGKINDIGTVEFTTSCRDKIKEARSAYDALPPEKKNLISNYSTLTEAVNEYARLKAQYTPDVANASLTLGDDLGLNFYITGIDNASEYKVKFTGKCVQNGQTVDVVEKNGKFFATANVYAKDIDADITAVLYKGEEQVCEAKTTSVSKYLNSLIETPDSEIPNSENVKALAKATLAFGAASGDYFYSDVDHGFAAALANAGIDEAKILGTAKAKANMFNTPDTLISLVLDSNTAIRVYIKGIAAGTEASLNGGTITAKTSSSAKAAMGYDSYFEIEGLDPQQFGTVYKINVNGKDYEFTALSWANRVIRRYENDNASVAEKDVKMAKAVTAYYLAAKNIFSN